MVILRVTCSTKSRNEPKQVRKFNNPYLNSTFEFPNLPQYSSTLAILYSDWFALIHYWSVFRNRNEHRTSSSNGLRIMTVKNFSFISYVRYQITQCRALVTRQTGCNSRLLLVIIKSTGLNKLTSVLFHGNTKTKNMRCVLLGEIRIAE